MMRRGDAVEMTKFVAAFLVAASVAGCASGTLFRSGGGGQTLSVDTSPRANARCDVWNANGSWYVASTPGSVAISPNAPNTTVSCRTSDGWHGSVVLYPSKENATLPDPVTVILSSPEPSAGMLDVAPPPEITGNDMGMASDANVILRFQTLRALLDSGLITRDEFNSRRGANLGALLRYSAPPPLTGLGRPAPPPQQVIARLKFLVQAYANHAISADEQETERAIILDALIPDKGTQRENPPAVLTDRLAAAAAVGRLERLRGANVINDEEGRREKAAIFRVVEGNIAASEAAARVAAGLAAQQAAMTTPTGPGIRLSTYRTQAQAEHAWASLQKAHPDELGNLRPVIVPVSIHHRPAVYRLQAGPVADEKAAAAVCRMLKRHGAICTPVTLGAR
jgi:hypothetical protein